jgi:pimeloyl-ACP methyl ester carboxylesterase
LALDWRGHGASAKVTKDFGEAELVADALAIIEASGARTVIPVALAHSGWVVIELRRRLGPRIPAIVLLEWFVLGAPPAFVEALRGLQSQATWQATVDGLMRRWIEGAGVPRLERYMRGEMGAHGFEMWARAGRAIEGAYKRHDSPLAALAALHPKCPVLHLYAQPADPEYLAQQQAFSVANPWFRVLRLDAKSHFPMFEVPDDMARAIESFATSPGS